MRDYGSRCKPDTFLKSFGGISPKVPTAPKQKKNTYSLYCDIQMLDFISNFIPQPKESQSIIDIKRKYW